MRAQQLMGEKTVHKTINPKVILYNPCIGLKHKSTVQVTSIMGHNLYSPRRHPHPKCLDLIVSTRLKTTVV